MLFGKMNILEALEAMGSLFIAVIIISIIITTFFIWIGTKIAGYKNFSFQKSLLIATFASLLVNISTIFFYVVPNLNTVLGFFIGVLSTFLAVKKICNTTSGKTFLIWTLNVAAQIIAVITTSILFIGGIRDLMKII